MILQMKPLAFDMKALEPYISEKTFEFHYGKHYATYVQNTNDLIADTPLQDMDLISIIHHCAGKSEYQSLFNNAAQVFNHEFFWNSLTDDAEKRIIPAVLADKIVRDFKSYDDFANTLLQTALKQFGSGWTWLISDNGVLKVVSTSNAILPMGQGIKPLLCIDVWEHAYYLDYQNRRADFVKAVIGLLNWQFAWENYNKGE